MESEKKETQVNKGLSSSMYRQPGNFLIKFLALALVLAIDPFFPETADAWRLRGQRPAAAPAPQSGAGAENAEGLKLFNSGDFGGAIGRFKKAAELKPDYNEALFNLGAAYFMAGDYASAEPTFKAVLKADPDFPEAQNYLGKCYANKISQNVKANRYDEAEAAIAEYSKQPFITESAQKGLSHVKEFIADRKKNVAEAGEPVNPAHEAASRAREKSEPAGANSSGEREKTALSEAADKLLKNPSDASAYEEITKPLEKSAGGAGAISETDMKKLEAALNEIVENDMRNIKAHMALGLCYRIDGDFDRSEYHYSMILNLDPDNLAARNAIAVIDREKESRAAISGKLRERMPSNAPETAAAADDTDEIENGPDAADGDKLLSSTIASRAPKQILDLKQKIEANSANLEDMRGAVCYYISKKDFKKAESIVNAAFAIDPSDNEINYLMAYVKIKLKKKKDALPYLFSINPDTITDAALLHDAGVLLMKLKQFDRSVLFFQKGIEANPSYIENHISLSIHYSRVNDFEAARKYFKEALEASPNNMRVFYFMALSMKREGDFEGFLETCARMQEMSSTDEYSRRIRHQMGLAPGDRLISYENENMLISTAKSYLKAGDSVKALRKLSEALKVNPESSEANSLMAEVAGKNGDKTGRLIYLLKTAKIKPSINNYAEIGRGFFSLGLNAPAREYFTRHIAKNPQDSQVKLEYAKLLMENGAPISARTLCEAVASRAKTPEEAEAARALMGDISVENTDTAETGFIQISEENRKNALDVVKKLYENEMFTTLESVAGIIIATGIEMTPEFYETYAGALLKNKKFTGAIDMYKKLIEKDMTNYFPYMQIGAIYMKRNNFKRAEEYFRQALIYRPDDPEIHLSLGDACFYQKNTEDAEVAYSEGLTYARNILIKEELQMKLEKIKLRSGIMPR